MKYTPIIGLEVHIEFETKSKMFCSCSAGHFGRKPNTQVCPVCLGLPGALPAPNKKAIEWTILVGLALNCRIPIFSKFDRKNYFYPDLPKGYQISQYGLPLAINGKVNFQFPISNFQTIRIKRVHLEEDTGKLIHVRESTLIDFNRSGVPLMEIVTEPDVTSALQAKTFLQKLQQIVRYLGVSEADMEKGQMRCEPTVNLKIVKNGKTQFTPLVEIKNINSFRFVQRAIEFEIDRQLKEFPKKGVEKSPGTKTTRGWDEVKQKTVLQREKEEAADYRYFPEPDLPPMRWRDKDIKILRDLLPELPDEKLARFVKQYGLSEYYVRILTEIRQTADYFEEAVKLGKNRLKPQEIANVIINKRINILKTSSAQLVKILVKKQKRLKISEEELKKVILEVLKENQKAVQDYLKGKTNAIQFLVGRVIAKTKGQADPEKVRKLVTQGVNRVSP